MPGEPPKKRIQGKVYRHSSLSRQGGQILQYFGNGTLRIFGSTLSAVRCACTLQKLFLTDPIIPVLTGIHTGDLLIAEADIRHHQASLLRYGLGGLLRNTKH